jgi:hypothetical protein
VSKDNHNVGFHALEDNKWTEQKFGMNRRVSSRLMNAGQCWWERCDLGLSSRTNDADKSKATDK